MRKLLICKIIKNIRTHIQTSVCFDISGTHIFSSHKPVGNENTDCLLLTPAILLPQKFCSTKIETLYERNLVRNEHYRRGWERPLALSSSLTANIRKATIMELMVYGLELTVQDRLDTTSLKQEHHAAFTIYQLTTFTSSFRITRKTTHSCINLRRIFASRASSELTLSI